MIENIDDIARRLGVSTLAGLRAGRPIEPSAIKAQLLEIIDQCVSYASEVLSLSAPSEGDCDPVETIWIALRDLKRLAQNDAPFPEVLALLSSIRDLSSRARKMRSALDALDQAASCMILESAHRHFRKALKQETKSIVKCLELI